MGNRNRRTRAAEPASDTERAPKESSRKEVAPPRRNPAMLTISIIAFLMWLAFLLYVALFE